MSEQSERTTAEGSPRDGEPDDEAFTGPPASEGERRAALRLAEELDRRGHQVKVDPISVRVETGLDTVTHVVLALASGILGLVLPLAGAAGCLAVAFSFFSGRSLGFPLIGRLLPKRATQNVLSPEPGPAWIGLDVIICAGYDANRPYPFAKFLERFWSGRLTIDRIAFWGGMIPLFAVLMLRVTGVDGTAIGVIQLLVSIVLLGVLAAEADRRLVVDRSGPDSRPAAALGVIVSRNPVYSALCLVLAFFTSAALWLLIEAEFLAIVLVLVYVGAVMVLFLFVVMMLDINVEEVKQGFTRYAWLGWVVSIIVIGQMVAVFYARDFGIDATIGPVRNAADYSNTRALGEVLYTQYVYPFELAAVLLLVAIVAAISLTMRKRPGLKPQDVAKQVAVRREDRVKLVKDVGREGGEGSR